MPAPPNPLLCFTEKGFHGTAIEDITARAETSRATLYQYFESKQAIFVDLMHESGGALGRVTRRLDQLGPTGNDQPRKDGTMSNFFADYLAAWDTLDADSVMAFFTDDIEYEDTTIGHGAKGAERMLRFVQASFENVPELRMEYVSHFSTGTNYAMEWIMQPMNVRGVSIGKLRDGRICENRDYWNGALFRVPNT